jgi:UDP-N-acetylmuramate dehydrogenase
MKLPHEVIGYGANILVSDNGYDGLIICLRDFEKTCLRSGNHLLIGAGVLLNDAILYAAEQGLAGMEALSGIPGTVGGAVKMNAGAYGTEMKDIVTRINVLTLEDGTLMERVYTNDEALFDYRKADGLLGKLVLGVDITLTPGDKDTILAKRKEILKQRTEKQPLNYPSCGSVFKRPTGNFAGTLIEQCGLKGYTIGGAQVSEKHANFIVNLGDATSSDIYNLITHVKKTVFIKTKVMLEEEVKFIGNV